MEENNLINQQVISNNFFHDFLVFLKYLEERPIKRTITGNISLADIFSLQKQFHQQEIFSEYKKYNWSIRSERQIEFLSKIKIIAESMYVIYKRKEYLILSKNGKGYLHNIDPVTQYWNMVLHYWNRVSWEYFNPSPEINKRSVMDVLQHNQHSLWNSLLRKGIQWIDFESFCQAVKIHFKLEDYYKNIDDFSYYLDIEYGLLKRNIFLFGCVEVEYKKDKYKFDRISHFRPTELGIFMFEKGINSII
ncbi:hypothetical protein A2767_07385 [Candidatus Roizmanbacteria bacterium RIFCSPHIGHO2_01_FULL_35_10]|uniref:Uncharacterized protein n=1 Tax=Candidatus Roizmanbacteria bacterium RIFCSPLOWO2_01_FULL_35_13 TaxID=1802055 RepID=A0A1F7I6R1_9BACT|nr:MAG: hypothetical protein A2767_07385 [Candidatus Roizmanbacteria bacterium RIFCSPHIGHO2_01_FULL_35_10]OGK39051.1 MAG: hypothetical protein A3A74_08245 [Candidatus Roizmanbacteria bacterium RIFCSPLOWO2_01_FULL_35_13]